MQGIDGRDIQKTILDNGVRVITEEMPHLRSTAVGVWLDAGSRHERASESGITHFLEHMVFKGSKKRTAEEIAFAIDGIGGHLDAFTTKETTAFTVRALDRHLPLAVDVIADMVLRPLFPADEIKHEKNVVLEELKMDEDSPDYLIHEIFSKNFWSRHSLGRPIIGSKTTIKRFDREQIEDYYRKTLQPQRVLVSAAGALRHGEVVELIDKEFGSLVGGEAVAADSTPVVTPRISLRDKPALEQVHLTLGVEAHRIDDPRRFAGYLLNTMLGGGVSSRLFLKIRERAGLAYSVFSDLNLYADTGCLSIYAGTSLKSAAKVVKYVLNEFRDLKRNPVPAAELTRTKEHIKGSLLLSLESSSSRMSNLAHQERYFGKVFSLDETLERIDAVTAEQITELAQTWFRTERIALAVMGDLHGFSIDRDQLTC